MTDVELVGNGYRFEPPLRERVRDHLGRFAVETVDAPELRAAAVAVTLIGGADGHARFLLTRRRRHLRRHSGQFALPGGRVEPGETPEEAARRELAEEVGLALPPEAVLGRLDDYPTRSGHLITPVVMWGMEEPTLTIDPSEVERLHLVPLTELDQPGNPRFDRIPESERTLVVMALVGRWVFAPTAALLYQFREVALHGRWTRVRDLEQPVFAWR